MKKIFIILLLVGFIMSNSIIEMPVYGERYENEQKDPKQDAFLYVFDDRDADPAVSECLNLLRKETAKKFSVSTNRCGLRMNSVRTEENISSDEDLADQIMKSTCVSEDRAGGVFYISIAEPEQKTQESVAAEIGVYHYSMPPLPEEHITSPEYSFKFGSDSALLAINLHNLFTKKTSNKNPAADQVLISPASSANPYASPDVLRKTVFLTLRGDPENIRGRIPEIADLLYEASENFFNDDDYYVMGLIPEKTRRHAKLENVNIRVYRQFFFEDDLSEKEKEKRKKISSRPRRMVKPFSSGLYYINGLERLAPYSLTFIDASKDKNDFWRETGKGSFVTSSLQGVVRTIPCVFEKYEPLKNWYREPWKTPPQGKELDYVIEDVTIFDGTREAPRFVGDVGIFGEKIAAVGQLNKFERKMTIEGKGLFLTPGFIDIHSHVDGNVFDVAYAPSHIRQGITTVLGGNCSFSPLGIGSFYRDVETSGSAVNIGMLIGNRPVRKAALGYEKGMPSYSDVYREKELVDLAMEEGAFGMSSGLIYSISEEAFAFELAELSKQIKPYGGFYASHIRGETDEVIDAVRECIYIGEMAEIPVQVSHMKVINKRNWGDMERYLDVMKNARARGLDVTGDQYPWRASGPAAHYRLHKLLVREAIKNETPEVVLLKNMPGKYKKYSGRPLVDLLKGENMTPAELIEDLNITTKTDLFATYLCLGDEDVRRPMKEDFVMVCTDSSLVSFEDIESGDAKYEHPRKFRSYPEFLANYVRDREVCSWELGIYKCTGLPASRMKLTDRGIIRPGACADLVLFDPEELSPNADYRDQAPAPKGIEWVFLNGQPALKQGEMTRIRAGKALHAYGNRKP